jgi:outer membrane receptor protein involved in Fe transport
VQFRQDAIHAIELSRTKNRTLTTKPLMLGDINEFNSGVYKMQKVAVSKKLDVIAGLRVDYFRNRYKDKRLKQVLQAHEVLASPKLNFNLRLNKNVRLYWYNGRGFHSNDTRAAVQKDGRRVLPPAYGTDLGGVFKIGRKLVLQSALRYLWMQQEFVYVGDEGAVEPSGKTRRMGIDVSVRYGVLKNLFADVDLSLARPRALTLPKSESYLPLAPQFTSVGGLTYRKAMGWNGSLRYRYMADRPANESNSTVAKGYFIKDAAVNYTTRNWECGLSVQTC